MKQFFFPFFLITIFLQTSVNNLTATAQSTPGKKFTVTIDAGHGGHDTGAPGKKSKEKNIALGIALKLGHYLESLMEDVNVFYTRKTDVFIPLYERAQIANRNKSDLFISIHVNAVEKRTAPTGTSTYVMGFSKSKENLDLVKQENKAIYLEKDYQTRYAGFDPTSDESYIFYNLVQNNNLTQSLEIATAVQDQLRTQAKRKDTGVYQGNLVVLWGCAKPSVLIETGFISNPQEEAFLMTESGQDIIASAIYTAVREYKESVDAKVSNLEKTTVTRLEIEMKKLEAEKKPVEIEKKPVEIEKKTADPEKKVSKIEKKPIVIGKEKLEADRKLLEVERKPLENLKTAEDEKKGEEQERPNLNPVDSIVRIGADTAKVEYRVQILASVKKIPLDSRDFKGVKSLKEYKIDGYYKYMSKSVYTYPEALELRRILGDSFRGAFIVAFQNGVRVPLNSSIEQRKN